MVHSKKIRLVAVSTVAHICGAFLLGTSASAQTITGAADAYQGANAGSAGTDIVVTAQRRAERLQDVPVSITAVNSQNLESVNATSLKALPQLSPTLNLTEQGGYVLSYIRGIGSTNTAPGAYSSVATYIDGIYISRFTSANLELDNVDSIQVLAGPQGALYGRNATGGAILLTTKTPRPGDPLSGRVTATYGNYDDRRLTAAFSSGFGDIFAANVSVVRSKRDGFRNNLNPAGYYQSDPDDRDVWAASTKLAFEPSPDFRGSLSFTYSRELDRSGSTYFHPDTALPGPVPGLNTPSSVLFGTLLSLGYSGADAFAAASSAQYPTNPRDSADSMINPYELGILPGKHKRGAFIYNRDINVGLNLTYSARTFDIQSTTGYTNNKNNAAVSYITSIPLTTGLPSTLGAGAGGPSETIQQELRAVSTAGSINWLVGLNYYRENGTVQVGASLPLGFGALFADNRYRDEAIAAFAQVTVPLNDQLKITGGGRYTTEKYSLSDRIDTATTGVPNTGNSSQRYKKFTYSARVEYTPAPDYLVYAGLTTGFKSGALNATAPGLGQVTPENVKSYELGYKTQLFDRRVTLNGALYYYTYSNIQTIVLDGQTGGAFLLDGLKGRGYGADANLDVQVTDELRFNAGISLLDAKYTNDTVTPNGTVYAADGNRLVGASRATINAGITYDMVLDNDAGLAFNVNGAYNSGFWFDAANLIGTGGVDAKSYLALNTRATYTLPGGKASIAAYATNIADDRYFRGGVIAAGAIRGVVPAVPRQYGVTLAYKF